VTVLQVFERAPQRLQRPHVFTAFAFSLFQQGLHAFHVFERLLQRFDDLLHEALGFADALFPGATLRPGT
jgi:hypothetical protein